MALSIKNETAERLAQPLLFKGDDFTRTDVAAVA
jgi:uncharacterized protein with PIN domain